MKKFVLAIGILVLLMSQIVFGDGMEFEEYISVELQDGSYDIRLVDDFFYEYDLQEPITSHYKLKVAIRNAIATEGIVNAEKVVSVTPEGLPDYLVASQDWRFEYIKLDEVWDELDTIPYLEGQLNPIIVAVIDTGVNVNHPDLNLILDVGSDVADEDDNPSDKHSHGTHVAGIVGAKKEDSGDHVVGIAPGVKILPIKIFEDGGATNTYYLEKGIQYAIDHNVDIITMSISFPEYITSINELLMQAEEAGIVVIAGVGNESNNWIDGETYNDRNPGQARNGAVFEYPAAIDTVIAVGAVAKHPSIDEIGIADYSSVSGEYFGDQRNVDVVAPGSKILSSHISDSSTAAMKTGTSMATPHVAGFAALLMAKYPQLTPAQIREVIRTTAYDPGIVIPDGYDRKETIGDGLINIQEGLYFSPLLNLSMGSMVDFEYKPMEYSKTYNVTNDINLLNISSTVMDNTTLKINGETTFTKDVSLAVGSNVITLEAYFNGVTREYSYTIIRDAFTDSLISNITVSGPLVSSVSKTKDKEFQAVVENDVENVSISIDLKDPNALITFDCVTHDYTANTTTTLDLLDTTTGLAFMIKTPDGIETRYLLSIPHRKDLIRLTEELPLYEPADRKIIYELPSEVEVILNTDIVALEYGLDADNFLKSYTFLASVKGTSKKDVIWSLDDDSYATIDQNGKITAKDDIEEGVGIISVTVTATTVVGAVSDSARVIFVERTPLGNENFSAPYISGYVDGTFKPKNDISRAEVATIFSKILNLDLEVYGSQVFSDVGVNYWGYPYIQAMHRTGIFAGYNEDGQLLFRPESTISRAELAQVFTSYWTYRDVVVDGTANQIIPDVTSTHWASEAIHRLYNTGIFNGYINNAYRPSDDTLREQIVNMTNKLIARPALESEIPKFSDVTINHEFYGDIEAASSFYFKKIDE